MMTRRKFLKVFGALAACTPAVSSFKALWAPTPAPTMPAAIATSGKAIAIRNEISHAHDALQYCLMGTQWGDKEMQFLKNRRAKAITEFASINRPTVFFSEEISKYEFKRRFPPAKRAKIIDTIAKKA